MVQIASRRVRIIDRPRDAVALTAFERNAFLSILGTKVDGQEYGNRVAVLTPQEMRRLGWALLATADEIDGRA